MTSKYEHLHRWNNRRGPFKPWFAWRPVILGLHGRVVWLRWVRRRVVTAVGVSETGPYKTWRLEYHA